MKNRLLYFSILLLLAAGFGCTEDCPTCPKEEERKPYKGWLYYTEQADGFCNLYQVDMETDSIVDSITYNPSTIIALGMDVSPDGRYLAVAFAGINNEPTVTRIYDAQTLQLLTELPKLYAPLFDPGSGMLIGNKRRTLTWMAPPSFQVVREDTTVSPDEGFSPCYSPFDLSRHLIYGTHFIGLGGWGELSSYDYVNRKLVRIPLPLAAGDTILPFQTRYDAQRNRLFFKSKRWYMGHYLMAYDLTTQTFMWSYPTLSPAGNVAVSPDGSEVWMTDPGWPGTMFDSGTIYVFDAASGAYLQGISLYGYGPNPLGPLGGADIIFSPTGEKAYVSTGYAGDRPTGSMLVVDTKLKKIIKVLTPDYKRSPMVLAIGPKT